MCRNAVREAEALLARLKEWPDRAPVRDVTDAVMARVRAEQALPSFDWQRAWRPALAVAAMLVVAAGMVNWSLELRQQSRRLAASRGAAKWLAASQDADGHWGAAGRPDTPYLQALTGLGLLAGLECPGNAKLEKMCARAADRLIQDQDKGDGRFGPLFAGTPYNQGIATLALLTWCGAQAADALPPAAGRAVRRIVDTQGGSGGWGYAAGDPEPNVSITIWQLQALHKAVELGIAEAEPAMRRGLRWLRTMRNAEGLYGYRRPEDYPDGPDTLTAMGLFCELACDPRAAERPEVRRSLQRLLQDSTAVEKPASYYAAYFVARVLRRADQEGTEAMLGQMQKALLIRQIHKGAERGSWDVHDAYAGVGGRVYTTAMATLALNE